MHRGQVDPPYSEFSQGLYVDAIAILDQVISESVAEQREYVLEMKSLAVTLYNRFSGELAKIAGVNDPRRLNVAKVEVENALNAYLVRIEALIKLFGGDDRLSNARKFLAKAFQGDVNDFVVQKRAKLGG